MQNVAGVALEVIAIIMTMVKNPADAAGAEMYFLKVRNSRNGNKKATCAGDMKRNGRWNHEQSDIDRSADR